MKSLRIASLATAVALEAGMAFGASHTMGNPMVDGAAIFETRTIVEAAVNSADHTMLVVAVKAAGLSGTLTGEGPFSVFAPTHETFAKLPAGTVQASHVRDPTMPEDEAGSKSTVTIADVRQSNRVSHVIDAVRLSGM